MYNYINYMNIYISCVCFCMCICRKKYLYNEIIFQRKILVQGFKIYVSMVTPTQNAPHLYGSPFHAAAPCPQPCLLYALSSPDLRVSHLALSTDSVCRVQVEKEMLLKAEIVIA